MHAVVSTDLVTRILSNGEQIKTAIIGLHGWKGDERVLEPVAKMMKLENVKWYFPKAPYKSDDGAGFTWFSGNDEVGWEYEKTWMGLYNLIKKIQDEGFDRKNIFFLGFSQGACLAIEFTLRLPYAIGGIIPIAGFIKKIDLIAKEATNQSKGTPVLLLHGEQDMTIPFNMSETAKALLEKRGHKVFLYSYEAAHKISTKSFPLIKDFVLNPIKFFYY